MAVVIGNAGLLARRIPPGDPMRPFVDEIAAAGHRAAELTRHLLAFSRAQVPATERLPLTGVVTGVTAMLRRVIGEEIALATDLGADTGFVEADRGRIEQVIMNLAVNARDAMPRGGTLTIVTDRVALDATRATVLGVTAGQYAHLVVSDTGTGMDEHVLAHLFDPFFTTKADGAGTGLGLSTVYGIVRQAGGAIEVTSAPGQGARFDVYFPRVEPPAARAPRDGAPEVPRGTETVLVAEDQVQLLTVVGATLRDLGYAVLEATDPLEALHAARDHRGPIDLLLADVVMPRMRGPELAARVRELRPEIRVVFMSGYVDDGGLGREGERVDLIAKPFAPEALARKIREVLDRARSG
jgi:CheY-like chemotaxis protein